MAITLSPVEVEFELHSLEGEFSAPAAAGV